MGRQIRFFMDSRDEAEFLRFVCSSSQVQVLAYRSSVPEPQELEDLSDAFRVWLFNKGASSRLALRPVEGQKLFMVDEFTSSVIEFSRTIVKNGKMHPGRLWAEFRFLDPEEKWVSKEPQFTRWYNTLSRWIRTHCSREVDPDFYFGPGALELFRQGKVEVRYF